MDCNQIFMSGISKKIQFLSTISEHFVQKPNPYVEDSVRQTIKFKEALTFGLLLGSTAMMTLKALKQWRSKPLSAMIGINIVASGAIGLWMLNDLNQISKRIPLKQIQARVNSTQNRKQSNPSNQEKK